MCNTCCIIKNFRSQYIDGDILDTSVSNIRMDSAGIRNTGLGKAAYVEKCQCPVGYTGLSCEVKKLKVFFL